MRSPERSELNPELFIEAKISEIKETVGNKRALVAVSGGVDSATCAVLAHKALGEQVDLIFIDDGLMREGEAKQVQQSFRKMGLNVEVIEAQDAFFKALKGFQGDKQKREIFQGQFYFIIEKESQTRKIVYVIQGTIQADRDETDSGLKIQHNVNIDPQKFGLKEIIEPLKDIYKDEVRQVARALGMPKEITERMPFPGPGLAIRVKGEVTPEKVEIVRKATTIVEEELTCFKAFQTFAVLLSDRSTGVSKGERTYGNIIMIRSVESEDALTASVNEIPLNFLHRVQKRITDEIPEVNRVAYDLTPKPPATIEYE